MSMRPGMRFRLFVAGSMAFALALSARPAFAYCLDPSCCFGTNSRAALAILAAAALAAAFPLLSAAETGLQALLGALMGAGTPDSGGLASIAPAAGGGDSRVAMHPDGSFSMTRWDGYPAGVPVPGGPFRVPDVPQATAAAGSPGVFDPSLFLANSQGGKVLYTLVPAALGGAADDPANIVALTPEKAAAAANWWDGVLGELPSGRR